MTQGFDTEEIVVKSLGRNIRNIEGLAGATILGDGGLAIILDIITIGKSLSSHHEMLKAQANDEMDQARRDRMITFLIFENQKDERFATPLSEVNRILRVNKDEIITSMIILTTNIMIISIC